MIIVNLWIESGCKLSEGEYSLTLAATVNDQLHIEQQEFDDLHECIRNCDHEFKEEVLYEICLQRAQIASAFPLVEYGFDVEKVTEIKTEEGMIVTSYVQL